MFCKQCGMEVPEGGMFCPNCGDRLQDDTTQVTEEPRAIQEPEGPEPKEETGQGQKVHKRFCPNCGTENSMEDTFCRECGMPLDGTVYSVSNANQRIPGSQPPMWEQVKKRKGLVVGVCAVAAVFALVVIVMVVRSLTMDPKSKVIRAVAATMDETPEIVKEIKSAGDILLGSHYTMGLMMEVDGDTVSGEFRNQTADKQIYLTADLDGEELDLLCGVHSGVFRAAVSEWDYVFTYDPKKENDGYLCEQLRKKEVEQLNSMLENITSNQDGAKELQKELMTALLQVSEELEFKAAKTKEFKVDGKGRECKGYKVRIDEKNVSHFVENAGEIMTRKMPEDLADEFADSLEDLVDEIEDDDFDVDFTFYLYRKKLAAVIIEMDEYRDRELVIEFQGGDYRMQNILLSLQYDGDIYAESEISSRKKGSVETINIESDSGDYITITYDKKSGAVSLEYDDGWVECFMEGIYKHSGSEASFELEELEFDGDSLMDDDSVMIYVKKAVEIQKYSGTEFDLGGAEEDDFEDLIEDLRENSELFEDLFYVGDNFVGPRNFLY